ncbi:hypothetical protein LTR53_001169 [Teratosphaeriaceae sp. CCFEE 6253]|nr:hypothetical protein LTR53_001169 [Teratosphaeriaceae sp. CCFEE 6253]
MAQVALPTGHHRHTSSIGHMQQVGGPLLSAAPRIEMMRNPDFSFPALPRPSEASSSHSPASRSWRPVSMHSNAPSMQPPSIAHRRNQSALPSFSFNAEDASGLNEEAITPPHTPDETSPETPSSRHHGHRRGVSEFVGGDSRLGVGGAISSSPTKSSMLPLPVPSPEHTPAKRGHRHRRSGALGSTHDARDIMQAASAVEPRPSLSLPSTPLDLLSLAPPLERAASSPDIGTQATDVFAASIDTESRPSSRRVGFSDNVEFIPRPLSTISSGTESSMSTVRGHSVNNSISSVLSLSTPSPPSRRDPRRSLSTTFEDESNLRRKRSSLEVSKRLEKEGEWLKSRSSQSLTRPLSEPVLATSAVSFAEPPERLAKRRNVHSTKHSLSHALGLDRRRSEPAISLKSNESSRSSAVSLQDELAQADAEAHTADDHLPRQSSTKKVRHWAFSRFTRRSSFRSTPPDEDPPSLRPADADNDAAFVPGMVPASEESAAETNLDAVFGAPGATQRLNTPPQPRIELSTPTPSYTSSFHSMEMDEASHMVDLDAALGPLKTPHSSSQRPRKQLHSSRGTQDFFGPGMHYHRRAESAPELVPFSRGSMVSQSSSLPDVFEGEGDEEVAVVPTERPTSSHLEMGEEGNMGVHIVDAVESGPTLGWSAYDGLRIRAGEWDLERPTTSHGNMSSRLSTPSNERRPSSIIEQTIVEESSPVDAIAIVDAEDEPRASSLTKSSDSSETPTLLAAQPGTLHLPAPDGPQSMMTPDTYQTSTFSSPDFTRRQGSFDTSRVGTAASSLTDNRTMSSSCGPGDHFARNSTDVPSLTSSRSTAMSTLHANSSHRDFGPDQPIPPVPVLPVTDYRRKRASIQSLSQLVGGSVNSNKSKPAPEEARPHTAADGGVDAAKAPRKKEHRLKKLMFWRSKSKQSLHSVD